MSKGDLSEFSKHHGNGTETMMVVWTETSGNFSTLPPEEGEIRGAELALRAGFA